MPSLTKLAAASLLAIAATGAARPASAGTSASGIYMILDPYNEQDYNFLKQAANTPCPAHQSANPSTFCGAVAGVLLRTAWCNFEPDHASEPGTWQSCGYMLGYTNASAKNTIELPLSPSAEYGTSCNQNFDTCSGKSQGTLGNALSFLAAINQQRALAHLAPLKLSIGLEAGMWTPRSVIAKTGYVDVPDSEDSSGAVGNERCLRLPLPWPASFVNAYEGAVDQLLAYTKANIPDADVEVVKLSPVGGFDLELEMPGGPKFITAPATDPGGKLQAGWAPIKCPTSAPSGSVWMNAYAAAPLPGDTLQQAVENTVGSVAGHLWATIAQDGFTSAQLSVPLVGVMGFPDIDCGLSAASTCLLQNTGNWSFYYFSKTVNDLFNGGLAYRAAAAAYQQVRPDGTFSLTPDQLDVLWTGVSTTPLVPSQQSPCILNNTSPANAVNMMFDGSVLPIQGAGTRIAWQTATQQGSLCSSKNHNAYMTVLENGITQGADFMEVEEDAAMTDVGTCGSDLASASAQLIASLQTSCQF